MNRTNCKAPTSIEELQNAIQMITTSIDKGFFDRDANLAVVTVLTLLNSYRPLSILNAEILHYKQTDF